MSVDLAIDYLASDKPFQNRLGPRTEGDEEGKENKQEEAEKQKGDGDGAGKEGGGKSASAAGSLHEALCDTIWGVDAMVRPIDIDVLLTQGSFLQQCRVLLCGNISYNDL